MTRPPRSAARRHFPNSIMTPQGRALVTLGGAARYITGLPKRTHEEHAWQTATHVLIQVADHFGPIEFARLGMMQALYPKGEPVYRGAGTKPKWRNNHKLVRDR